LKKNWNMSYGGSRIIQKVRTKKPDNDIGRIRSVEQAYLELTRSIGCIRCIDVEEFCNAARNISLDAFILV
jgi:hypothetical protein